MKKSNIFIISGPSGAGEDSIIDGLKDFLPIERVITTTTRVARKGEINGKAYYFISRDDFNKGLDRGDFAEHAEQYNGQMYGVTKKELKRIEASEKIGIWKIEYKGVGSVKREHPEIIAILINTTTLQVLEDRIKSRDNADDEYIHERMIYTREWLKHLDIYDYVVINEEGKLDEAIRKTAEIIKKHLR